MSEKQLSSSSVCEAQVKKLSGEKEKQQILGEQRFRKSWGIKRQTLWNTTAILTGGLRPDASPQLPIQIQFCDKCEYEPLSLPSAASSRLTGVSSVAAEDAVLSAVIGYTSSCTVHFRLLPAYILYTAGRFALQQQQQHRRGSQVKGQSHRVTQITNKMVAMMQKVIQARTQKINCK